MAILLPLDVAGPTLAALPYAISLAGALSTSIVVYHVAPGPPPLWILEALHRLAEPIKKAGLTHHLRVRRGSPAQAICEEAARRECQWIVLGAGAEPLGPVAGEVLRASAIPTLAVANDNTLRLTSPQEADRLCDLLGTRGVVGLLEDHVALSLVPHSVEHAI